MCDRLITFEDDLVPRVYILYRQHTIEVILRRGKVRCGAWTKGPWTTCKRGWRERVWVRTCTQRIKIQRVRHCHYERLLPFPAPGGQNNDKRLVEEDRGAPFYRIETYEERYTESDFCGFFSAVPKLRDPLGEYAIAMPSGGDSAIFARHSKLSLALPQTLASRLESAETSLNGRTLKLPATLTLDKVGEHRIESTLKTRKGSVIRLSMEFRVEGAIEARFKGWAPLGEEQPVARVELDNPTPRDRLVILETQRDAADAVEAIARARSKTIVDVPVRRALGGRDHLAVHVSGARTLELHLDKQPAPSRQRSRK